MPRDPSCGYDAIADTFIDVRSPVIGRGTVTRWAGLLPPGGSVLDVGAGTGEPITAALRDAGCRVSAIDAAPAMVAAFRARFPDIRVACDAVEDSTFFDETYDGVVCVGLLFLLPAHVQHQALQRMARVIKPGGRLLFSAPRQACTWRDTLTGQMSRSLGVQRYTGILEECGLRVADRYVDRGNGHYIDAVKATV